MVERVITVRLIGDARGFVGAFAQAGTASVAMGNKVSAGSNKAINAMRGVGKVAATVGKITILGFAAGLALSAKAAIDFESSFAGIRKTVDTSEAGFARLELSLRGLSKIIPVNINELNRIGELGGQLGVGANAIPQFTKTIAELGVTTNLSTEQAALGLARLDNILGLNQKSFGQLGSTIVDLGNNFATTESEILNFALRIAPVGGIVGLAAGEVLAIGTAFASVGVKAERGGTAVQRALIAISEAAQDGGKDLVRFAEIAGLSADSYKELVNTNSSKAFTLFINGLERITLEGGNVFQTLRDVDLGGVRTTQSLLAVASAGELIEDTLARQDIAWRDNVALTEEAEKRFDTTASKITIATNRLRDLAIDIGQSVLPQVGALAQGVADFGDGLALLPGFITNVIKVLAGLAAAAAVGNVALGLLTKAAGISLVASLGLGAVAAGGLAAVIGVGVVGAIGFAVSKITDMGAAQRETEARVSALVDALDLESEGFKDNGKAALRARIINEGLIPSLNRIGIGVDDFVDAIFRNEDALGRVDTALGKTKAGLDGILSSPIDQDAFNLTSEESLALNERLLADGFALKEVQDFLIQGGSDLAAADRIRLEAARALAENERIGKPTFLLPIERTADLTRTIEFATRIEALGTAAQITTDDINSIRDAVIDYGGALADSFADSDEFIRGQISAWDELGDTVVINVDKSLTNLNKQIEIIASFEALIRELNLTPGEESLLRANFGTSFEDQLALVQLALDKPLEFDKLIAGTRVASARIQEEANLAFLFGFDDVVREIAPELFDAMRKVVDNLVEEEGIDPAEAWVLVIKETLKASPIELRESIKTAIKEGFSNANSLLVVQGANAIDGLIIGIESKSQAVKNAMQNISRLLVRSAVQNLQIRSPSKIFMEIGKNVVDGFRIGLQDSARNLQDFGLNTLGIPNRHQLIGGSTTNTENSINNNFNLNVSGSNNVADDARSVLMTAQIIGAT